MSAWIVIEGPRERCPQPQPRPSRSAADAVETAAPMTARGAATRAMRRAVELVRNVLRNMADSWFVVEPLDFPMPGPKLVPTCIATGSTHRRSVCFTDFPAPDPRFLGPG